MKAQRASDLIAACMGLAALALVALVVLTRLGLIDWRGQLDDLRDERARPARLQAAEAASISRYEENAALWRVKFDSLQSVYAGMICADGNP